MQNSWSILKRGLFLLRDSPFLFYPMLCRSLNLAKEENLLKRSTLYNLIKDQIHSLTCPELREIHSH